MATCWIVGAGEFTSDGLMPAPGDLLIAADGGYRYVDQLGLKPQILLGDFDSLGEPEQLAQGIQLMRHPVRKDDTDTGLALSVGYEKGYRDFALYGCGGGRIDHLLANFQSMGRYAALGASVRLVDAGYTAYAVANGQLQLPAAPKGTRVSVFCHGSKACGVTLDGLSYPLTEGELTCDWPLGVSNEYEAAQPVITVREGALLVIVGTKDA